MPLGIYSLMLGPGDDSTRMLDLAVDRFGHIRGSYYDMVSGASYNVAGIVDPALAVRSMVARIEPQLTFYTPMGEMMQPQGLVYVQLPSGERQQWQLVRMEARLTRSGVAPLASNRARQLAAAPTGRRCLFARPTLRSSERIVSHSLARTTPRSVMIAAISSAGVTSNAGL